MFDFTDKSEDEVRTCTGANGCVWLVGGLRARPSKNWKEGLPGGHSATVATYMPSLQHSSTLFHRQVVSQQVHGTPKRSKLFAHHIFLTCIVHENFVTQISRSAVVKISFIVFYLTDQVCTVCPPETEDTPTSKHYQIH